MRLLPVFIAALPCLLACPSAGPGGGPTPVSVRDTITPVPSLGQENSAFPSLGTKDDLHLPYVLGATVTLVFDHEVPFLASDGWDITSDTPSVVEVTGQADNNGNREATLRCAGEGSALLTARDRFGVRRRQVELRVVRPDRVEVLAGPRALLRTRDLADAVLADRIAIARAAPVPIVVRAFRGTEELFGSGALQSEVTSGRLRVDNRVHFRGATRDWVILTPEFPGLSAVRLTLGDIVRDVQVNTVDLPDIVGLDVTGDDEGGIGEGVSLLALATGRTATGETVFGVRAGWTLGATRLDGAGDVFQYVHKPANNAALQARHGVDGGMEFSDEIAIHATEGVVSTSDTNTCAQAGVQVPALALLGLVFLRRARRAP